MNPFDYFQNPFLRSLRDEEKNLVRQKLVKWKLVNEDFFTTLDNWFFNFDEPEDMHLALKVFKNINYFSESDFENRLTNYQNYINRHLIDSGNASSNIVIVVPEVGDDSANRHAYSIVKKWKLPEGCVFRVNQLSQSKFQDPIFVVFNDTYGTGNQFVKTVWPHLKKYGDHKIFVLAMAISDQALDRFRKLGMHVPYHMKVETAGQLFTGDEYKRLYSIGSRLYPQHPMGYGGTEFLTAYHFQCPNNTIPIIWADGENNKVGDRQYPWNALFPYRPKIKSSVPKNQNSNSLSGKELYRELILTDVSSQEAREDRPSEQGNFRYKYRVGLLDLDLGLSDLLKLACNLNECQQYFYFTAPQHVNFKDIRDSIRLIQGNQNLSVNQIGSAFYAQFDELAVDTVGCFTRFPLAFLDKNSGVIKHNYFSGPSKVDRRFMFVSVDRLNSFSREANCSFEKGLVYILVSQLVVYFTEVRYHKATLKCPMDWCGNRVDVTLGLRNRRFCDTCESRIKDKDFFDALNSLLQWHS